MIHVNTRELLLAHAARYPLMEATDYAKLLYQSAFAGGHLIASREKALDYLNSEMNELRDTGALPLCEPIGGGLCRLYLAPAKRMGLRAETICDLFIETSAGFEKNIHRFESDMDELEAMCREGALNADASDVAALRLACREQGYPPFSHSVRYREAYAPAYRLVSERLCGLLDVFAVIDALLKTRETVRVALDGRCASGKTTAAALIARVYGAQLFHMDDFFLPFERKTPERLAQPGGNVDYERFQTDVLDHLDEAAFSYHPFDCQIGDLGEEVRTEKRRVQLVEGVYCLHPALNARYDLRVFLSVNPDLQRERIAARNPDKLDRFINEWIPLEEHYFKVFDIASTCDIAYFN